jgi:hypothetical protein
MPLFKKKERPEPVPVQHAGDGEAVLSAYGPDADDLFRVMERDLRAFGARPAWCLLRYGAAGDLTAKEQRIDL